MVLLKHLMRSSGSGLELGDETLYDVLARQEASLLSQPAWTFLKRQRFESVFIKKFIDSMVCTKSGLGKCSSAVVTEWI